MEDISALKEYGTLLKDNVTDTARLSDVMSKMSPNAKAMAADVKSGAISVETLSSAEKAASISTKVLGTALKFAFNVAILVGINLLVEAFQHLANKEKEKAEQIEEANQKRQEQIQQYHDEIDSLNNVIEKYSQYKNVVSLTQKDKKDLQKIQDDIIDKYGNEANNIDLVNGKYDEQIQKLKILSAEQSKYAYNLDLAKLNNTEEKIKSNPRDTIFNDDVITRDLSEGSKGDKILNKMFKDFNSLSNMTLEGSSQGYYSLSIDTVDSEKKLETINSMLDKMRNNYSPSEKSISEYKNTWDRLVKLQTQYKNKVKANSDAIIKASQDAVQGFVYHNKNGEDITYQDVTLSGYKEWSNTLIAEMGNGDPELVQAIYNYLNNNFTDAEYKFALMSDSDKSWYMQQKIKADATAFSKSNAKIETLTSWLKDNADAIDKVQTKAESLQTTFQSLSKGTITNSELVNLFQDYPQLAKYANDTDKLKGKIQELLKQNPKSLVGSLNKLKNSLTDKTEKQAVQNLIDQLTKLGNVSVDKTTESVTSLADALKDEKEVLDNISTAYSDTEQVVTDYIDAQVEKLNNEKQAVEDSYSDKITKSEASYDNQIAKIQKVIDGLDKVNKVEEKRLAIKEKENDLAEKQNDLAQKQNDMIKAKQRLENAKNNKNVLSYSESRGFYHEANQEDVQSAKDNLAQAKKDTADAKKAVKDAQDAIKQAQTDYTVSRFQEQINVLTAEKEKATKQLEKEQAKRSKAYDTEIKKWDKYKTSWSNLVNSYEQNTKKKIASQVLGTDYEEKLSKRSQTALNNFASNFNSYKDKLNKVENAIAKNEGALYAQRGKEITTYQNKLSNLEATIAKLNSSNISIKTANAVTKAATNVTMKFTDNWKKLNSAMATPTNKTFNINVDKIESNNPEQLYKDFRSIVNKIGNK